MLAVLIGLIAGIASTVQASINTEARRFFRSPFITAGINFSVAWLLLAAFIIITEHRFFIPVREIAQNPPWIWLGGVCAIIIVTLNIVCVPKLGAAGNVMILNFGQIVTGLAIDHFAMFGADKVSMSLTRLAGAVLVMAGMILVTQEKAPEGGKRSLPLLFAILAFIDGVACSTQIAVNGTLRVVIGSVSKATIVSMSVAILSTITVVAGLTLIKGRDGIFDQTKASGLQTVDDHRRNLCAHRGQRQRGSGACAGDRPQHDNEPHRHDGCRSRDRRGGVPRHRKKAGDGQEGNGHVADVGRHGHHLIPVGNGWKI